MDKKPSKDTPGRLHLRRPASVPQTGKGPSSLSLDATDLDLLERWLQCDTLDDLCPIAFADMRARCGVQQLLIVTQSDERWQRWSVAPSDEPLVREVDTLFASPLERVSLVLNKRPTGQGPLCAEELDANHRLRELGFTAGAHVSTEHPIDFCVFWREEDAVASNDGDGSAFALTSRPEWRVLVAVLWNMARMEHLRAISHIDSVTGILNRHYFNKRLIEEVARARRFQRPLALAVFDIDHFKSLNDTYGHQQGDVILRKMAEYVRWTIRSIDVFCRLGGDEFAVLMPDANLGDCAHFADRLLAVLSGQRFTLDNGSEVALAVSIGAAVFPEHADKHERLLWCADMALLEAKQRGRARYLMFEDSYGHHVLG